MLKNLTFPSFFPLLYHAQADILINQLRTVFFLEKYGNKQNMYLANIIAKIKLSPLDAQKLFIIPSVTVIFENDSIWYILYLFNFAFDFQVSKFIQEYFNNYFAENVMQSLSLSKGRFPFS